MPRKPRIVIPGQPLHVLQRGNNRQAIFFTEEDYRVFLEAVQSACAKYGCAVHAYVLMTNHVHMLVTPEQENSLSLMMQSVGRRYVRYVNDCYRRSGTLWEGRFKCSLIDTLNYLFTCFVYIEMNPVRAGMVAAPQDYRWSSFRANALGGHDPVLTRHELYQKLGASAEKRQQAYKSLFSRHFSAQSLAHIHESIENDLPLGDSRFKKEVERAIERSVSRLSHGGDRRSRDFQGFQGVGVLEKHALDAADVLAVQHRPVVRGQVRMHETYSHETLYEVTGPDPDYWNEVPGTRSEGRLIDSYPEVIWQYPSTEYRLCASHGSGCFLKW